MNKIKRKSLALFIVIITFAVILIRCAFNDNLAVCKYSIYTDKITDTHTFAVVSDLHSTYYGENQETLISKIDKYVPEAIFLTGDIADDVRSISGCDIFMNNIADRYQCYYVTGNHERWAVKAVDAEAIDMKAVFRDYGVNVLDGKSCDVQFKNDVIRIHGVDDPLYYSSYADFEKTVQELNISDEAYNILLSHRPEYAQMYSSCGFDLVFNGHAHGGQIRIPILMNGLYAPNQGWFPKIAGGYYQFDSTDVIVSRGLMIDDIPRIFNPPELVIVNLIPK